MMPSPGRRDVVEHRVGVGERRPGQALVDGRDADHVAERRRPAGVDAGAADGVADRGHDDGPAAHGVGDRIALGARELVELRVLRIAVAAEREVDHARAGADRVADGLRLVPRVDVAAADDAIVEQPDVRGAHPEPADPVVGVGGDDARDRRAVHERGRRIARLVDRGERHDAGQVGARAVDAAVDHGDRDRVDRHRQHVGVRERVDGGEVPLARRKRIGGRPRERARTDAELGRARAEERAGAAPAHAPAAARGAHREAERAVAARRRTRNPLPAAADDVLQHDGAARALREQAAVQLRARAPAQEQARLADDRHGSASRASPRRAGSATTRRPGGGTRARRRRPRRARRRRASRSPRRPAASPCPAAPTRSAARGCARRARAARCRSPWASRSAGETVNQVERSPKRLRASAAPSSSGPALPFSVTARTRPDGYASTWMPVTRPG